jgi:hypothetical protein
MPDITARRGEYCTNSWRHIETITCLLLLQRTQIHHLPKGKILHLRTFILRTMNVILLY